MKYFVPVQRIEIREESFVVEAVTLREAIERAEERAHDHNYADAKFVDANYKAGLPKLITPTGGQDA